MIAIVVAHSSNGVIGRHGALPWRLPSDLKHFRELTVGASVVMGRRTFESLPQAFRPLPDRRNLVLSSDAGYVADGAEVFSELALAVESCDGDCFVIGGEVTYRQALGSAERVYATEIDAEIDGDAFFPDLPEGEWRCIEHEGPVTESGHSFAYRVYDRVG